MKEDEGDTKPTAKEEINEEEEIKKKEKKVTQKTQWKKR